MYQYQLAPALRLPPDKVNVVLVPEQITEGLHIAEFAGVEFKLTVTVIDAIKLVHAG